LNALKKLPDESVDCIITSPPYYGLRSYKGAEAVWGGDPNCAHEWGVNISERIDYTGFERNRKGLNKFAEAIDGHKRYSISQIPPVNKNSSFCSKCGAWKGQLGLEPTYEMYLDHLLMVTAELKRVLKKTGTLFWNMGDSYASGGGPLRHKGYSDPKWSKARNGSFAEPTAYPQGIKPKSLMLIPERFAIGMLEQGWILRNKIIWFKRNAIPSSAKDRFSNKWEYIFFFVKSKKYYFDLDAVRKPLADPERMLRGVSINKYLSKEATDAFIGNSQTGINRPRPNLKNPENISKYLIERTPNGSLSGRIIRNIADGKYYTFVRKALTNVNEYLKEKLEKSNYSIEELAKLTGEPVTAIAHYFRTDSSGSALPSKTFWNKVKGILNLDDYDKFIKEELKSVIPAYEKGTNPGDVLEIATRPHHFAHFAVFPTTLVLPLMKAGCPPQGVVLDPFAGSGTTGVVAEILGRYAILIEISQEYVKIIEERLQPENLKKESEALKKYEVKIRGVGNADAT
jgi:DNA modification methylase